MLVRVQSSSKVLVVDCRHTFSRNHTSDLEFGSFPGPGKCGTTLSRDAGQWQQVLNVYHFCNIIKWKNCKLNHCKLGTVCTCIFPVLDEPTSPREASWGNTACLKLSVQWHLVTKLSVEWGPVNVDMALQCANNHGPSQAGTGNLEQWLGWEMGWGQGLRVADLVAAFIKGLTQASYSIIKTSVQRLIVFAEICS